MMLSQRGTVMAIDSNGGLIRSGTPVFRRTALALAAAGFSTFAVLYAVQPLLPIFSEEFGVSPAESSLACPCPAGCWRWRCWW